MGWDGMGWDGMGWDGMGWDGMGWDGMGWCNEENSNPDFDLELSSCSLEENYDTGVFIRVVTKYYDSKKLATTIG